ncbi:MULTISPECIES: hypothetical protein [Streptomyces]|nr:hypothetical protein [Streptomyces sp. DSM 41529]
MTRQSEINKVVVPARPSDASSTIGAITRAGAGHTTMRLVTR